MTSEFCAQCLSEAGPFDRLAWGKDGALVLVCQACQHEHPRDGRYSFSEATRIAKPCIGHRTNRRN